MKTLTIGERVRVTAGIPSFWRHAGRIVQIVDLFVGESMKEACLLELPLYRVRLDDGRSFRFRGRDLEPMNGITLRFAAKALFKRPDKLAGCSHVQRMPCPFTRLPGFGNDLIAVCFDALHATFELCRCPCSGSEGFACLKPDEIEKIRRHKSTHHGCRALTLQELPDAFPQFVWSKVQSEAGAVDQSLLQRLRRQPAVHTGNILDKALRGLLDRVGIPTC